MKGLQAGLLFENVHFHDKSIHSAATLLMTMRQLFVHVSEPQINLLYFFYVRKLVTVSLLDVFEEVFERRQLLDLEFDPGMLRLQSP